MPKHCQGELQVRSRWCQERNLPSELGAIVEAYDANADMTSIGRMQWTSHDIMRRGEPHERARANAVWRSCGTPHSVLHLVCQCFTIRDGAMDDQTAERH